MSPIAVWSPSAGTVTIITAEGALALPENRILAIADWLGRMHALMAGRATISISSPQGDWLRLQTADLPALVADIRAAFAIPQHVANLTAECAA